MADEHITYYDLDPEDMHTCWHCKRQHLDVGKHFEKHDHVCEACGHVIRKLHNPNNCALWLSPYSDESREIEKMEMNLYINQQN